MTMTEKRLFGSNQDLIKEIMSSKLFELIIGIDGILHNLNFKIKDHVTIPINMNAFGELSFRGDRIFLEYNNSDNNLDIDFFVQISAVENSAIYWFGNDYGQEADFQTMHEVNGLEKLKTDCLARN